MDCKFEKARAQAHKFLGGINDRDFAWRLEGHEKERADGMPGKPVGSIARSERLIWMREVRRQIATRGILRT